MTRPSLEARVVLAKAALIGAASALVVDPAGEETWQELCRARATLRALLRCAP